MELSNLPASIVLNRRNGEGQRPWRVALLVEGHAKPAKTKAEPSHQQCREQESAQLSLSFLHHFIMFQKKTRSLAQLRYLVTRSLPVVKAAAVDLLPSASQKMWKGPGFLFCRSRYAAKVHDRTTIYRP